MYIIYTPMSPSRMTRVLAGICLGYIAETSAST